MYFLSVVFVILGSFAYTHTSCYSRFTDSALLFTGRRFQRSYFHDGCGSHKQPRYVASNGTYNLCFPKGREGLFNAASCKFHNSKGYDCAGQTDDELDHWAATNSGIVLKVSLGGTCGLVGGCILLYFLYRLLKPKPNVVEPTPYTCNRCQRRARGYPLSVEIASASPPPYAAECDCQASAVSHC